MNERPHQTAAMKCRPDMDGLRARAVLSVLAFHIWPWRVSGGFIGVDVFFAISRYLTSSILFSEIASNRFLVLAFYERRIRRILPALFAMMIVFSAVIRFLLLPNKLLDYAKSVIAATTSTSNFYFWLYSGYLRALLEEALWRTGRRAARNGPLRFFFCNICLISLSGNKLKPS